MDSLTTALTTIRRSPYQAMISIFMITATFCVGFSFSIFLIGSNTILQNLQTKPQVIAFFKLETPVDDISSINEKIKLKPYVKNSKVINQEDALKLYQEENKDDPLLLELVTADILPASIEVSALKIDSLEKIKNDLDTFDQIDDIVFQEDVISILSKWIKTAEIVGISAISILAAISFMTVMTIIAMKATTQKKSIKIMRMLGATKGYIKVPFMLEGVIYGLAGSVLAWLITFAIFLYLTPVINQVMGDIKLLPIPIEYYFIHAGSGIFAGVILGAFAGLMAIQKLIKY